MALQWASSPLRSSGHKTVFKAKVPLPSSGWLATTDRPAAPTRLVGARVHACWHSDQIDLISQAEGTVSKSNPPPDRAVVLSEQHRLTLTTHLSYTPTKNRASVLILKYYVYWGHMNRRRVRKEPTTKEAAR